MFPIILHANDFGCVPDGRFLEGVTIDAGSVLLSDPDGVLRLTDVGKNIAIPGAIDLMTTIAGLVEHREVRNVKMDAAGQNPMLLKGTLFNPKEKKGEDEEDFVASVHVGRRITVTGAGPNGQTLVSDIVKVHNADTIELADPALTTVSGVKVILNRPDLVAGITPAAALITSPSTSGIARSATA